MKKTRKATGVTIIFAIALISMIAIVSAAIETTTSNGVLKTVFENTESVYLKSTSSICNNAFEEVNLYIVESGSEDLEDVRGEPQEVSLTDAYYIPANTLIWEEPEAGDYDVLIDCDGNEEYSALEPRTSFTVSAVSGNGIVKLGPDNPSDHSWRFDPEDEYLTNEMMQLTLEANGEDIDLDNITLRLNGPDGTTRINEIDVYLDDNNNGIADEDDEIIGEHEAEAAINNNVRVSIDLDGSIDDGEEINILIVYVMEEDSPQGKYSLEVESIVGEGVDTESAIKFSGLPKTSSVLNVGAPKSCLGEIELELNPETVNKGDRVQATISGLEGCENKRISLRENSCDSNIGEEVGFCISGDTGCQITLIADYPQTYYACIDKNFDGDMGDFGESGSQKLSINNVVQEQDQEPDETVVEEAPEETLTTEAEPETTTTNGVTGAAGALEGLTGNLLGAAGGFLILLEITLLLILFVLVMILFKLKGSSSSEDEEEEDEED